MPLTRVRKFRDRTPGSRGFPQGWPGNVRGMSPRVAPRCDARLRARSGASRWGRMTRQRASDPATVGAREAAEATRSFGVGADPSELIARVSHLDRAFVTIERAHLGRGVVAARPDVARAVLVELAAAVPLAVVANGARVGRIVERAGLGAVGATVDVLEVRRADRAPNALRGPNCRRKRRAACRGDRENGEGEQRVDPNGTRHGARGW